MKKTLWFYALGSIIVILIVHIVASVGTPTVGAGPQPSSTGGGMGS